MEFRNLTPFPALAFQGVDQREQPFHVIVLRQTFTWGEHGELIYADEQTPLCEVDQFCGPMNDSTVRQESDLCHYKPRCDVIVNAVAYAPRGVAATHFEVALRVLGRGQAALPPRPYGLNPLDPASASALRAWEAEVRQLSQGIALIDKRL